MDNLPAKILKISSYLIAPSLTAIFNPLFTDRRYFLIFLKIFCYHITSGA